MASTLLLVDDDEVFLKTTGTRLERFGYRVLVGRDGLEGLNLVKQERPDLILTDMLMPGMNGFTFCQKLRSNEATRGIPIIVLSAKVELEDSFKPLGVEDFMTKPVDFDMLDKKIRHHLLLAGKRPIRRFEVLALSQSDKIANKMVHVLQEEARCRLSIAYDVAGLLGHAIQIRPDMIFLDILIEEIPPDEIVRSLRAISCLKQTVIYIYHSLTTESGEEEGQQMKVKSLEELRQACLEAGADEDMGHFHEVLFKGCVGKYLK